MDLMSMLMGSMGSSDAVDALSGKLLGMLTALMK